MTLGKMPGIQLAQRGAEESADIGIYGLKVIDIVMHFI
jgi:hypothetical protein